MKFEDFLGAEGTEDILDKTVRLSRYLNGSVHGGNGKGGCKEAGDAAEQALGVQLLTAAGPHAEILDRRGKRQRVLMLGSNSYLNLTRHPQVMEASRKALEHYGYGMGAVSLYAGITDLHRQLERSIARFTGTEEAILFPSGYGANIGVLSALCGPGDVIINDAANHASLFDGATLSGAEVKIYPHGSMKGLERILQRLPDSRKGRLIVTDGVFSMHGDLAPLDEISGLAARYGARVLVDDAHGTGVVGPGGRGTASAFGVSGKVDLHMSMLSKAPAGLGGYCAGRKEVIDYLRLYARTYFFSTSLPAPVAAGLLAVFGLLESDSAGREGLWENIRYMHAGVKGLGFRTTEPRSGIVPVIVGDEEKLARLHRALLDEGVYTNIVTYPAVRRKECRLRLCVMSSLSRPDMDEALKGLERAGKQCGVL